MKSRGTKRHGMTVVTRSVQFPLVVDNVGVKYVGENSAKYLINAIKSKQYDLSVNWTGFRSLL